MTHSPPIPPGNQSPYPIEEPPHPHHDAPVAPERDDADGVAAIGTGTIIGAAVVAGIGAAAAAAAYFFSVRKAPGPKRKPRRRPAKKA